MGFLSLVLGFLIIKEGDPHQASALLAVQMVFWAIGLLDCEVAIVCNYLIKERINWGGRRSIRGQYGKGAV